MSFTDRFGGGSLTAAQVSYRAVSLSSDQVTEWPQNASADTVLARIMQVAAPLAAWSITLPDATEASPGYDVFFNNVGAFNVTIKNAAGGTLMVVSPGQVKYLYLTNTSTQAGSWQVVNLGNVASNIDAGALAGFGLIAIGNTLNQSASVSPFAGSVGVTSTDRAKVLLWVGGTGTLTLPSSATVSSFFFEIRNQGSGTLTIAGSGGELIDASASIGLQVSESAFVHAGTGAWYTVGRGRSNQFSFTQLVKTVTGGTVTLTLTEAANVVQTYDGVLISNVDIVVPPLVQVYYVSNQTTGAFNFRVMTGLGGTTVTIPTGQNAILFSDGTNVINASTTLAGISSIVFAAGSAASPSIGIGSSTTGLYSAGVGEVSVSSAGVKVAGFTGAGLGVTVDGGGIGISSAAGNATVLVERPVGSYGVVNYYTGLQLRWRHGVNNVAEGGANAGSNCFWERYNDAGASLGVNVEFNRATGLATFNNGTTVTGLATFNNGVAVITGGISSANGGISSIVTTGAGITSTSAGSQSTLSLVDNTSGAHLKMTGVGGGATAKFIRINAAGGMEWINNAYTLVIASLTDAGAFTAVSVGISSDRRLKNNIRSTLWSSVFRLLRVNGMTYTRGGKPELGLIAQDLDPVYPELVNKEQEFMSVNYMGLVGELVNSNKLLWAAVAILGALELWRAFS